MTSTLPHSLLAGRFEVLEQVGSGGMGTVYRALDRQTGQAAAIKLLSTERPQAPESERFEREARLLAELRHPAIVGYVAHGLAADGRPFLAMEWLDGEDLAQRLRKGPLSSGEVVLLLRQVAAALDFAHRAGVIHRDLKPSNIFLRGGHVESVALLDFGVARRTQRSLQVTRTGSVIGTPEYMAPEQARGERELGPAADLFSLGCVLYECLAGESPFAADHVAAVLAKILFAPPPPLRSPAGGVPPALAELVTSLLAKDPGERPRSAGELLARLEDLALPTEPPRCADEVAPRASLADGEQRLLSVLVGTPALPPGDEARTPDAATSPPLDLAALQRTVAPYGARLEALTDGSLVVTLAPGLGGATEQVAHAIKCALILRARCPELVLAVATGRGVLGTRLPVGEVLDRAGQLLRSQLTGARPPSEPIVIDEVTAGLVGGRYLLQRSGGHYTLQGEVASSDPSRPLLGRPTPCVGRESELGILEGALLSCIDEAAPRAVLITGAPGLGKSRLRHEFLRRLEQRGLAVTVWLGACDPLSPGSPYGPLSRALRQLCQIRDGETLAEKQDKLHRRIAEHLPGPEARHVAEFLGELCGVPFSVEGSIKLRAAKQDPRLMSDQVTQAFLRFLQAECDASPVLLVLEDLQWGDALTTRLIGAALLGLIEAPLLVLATARPEIHELFPGLWAGQVQPLPLRPLPRKASERMAQQFLERLASPATVAWIVERAAGNPLWLEELIRSTAEGNHDQAPQTVMAMLQARIGQLAGGARQVLRAASIFGETFWQDGVVALLGPEQREEVAQQIDTLLQRELLAINTDSRFPEQRELRFRHTLMREAAYSLLTEEDRLLGHRLAGAFLERHGEGDLGVLAEHARRGGQPERAATFYSHAAESALARNDIGAALRYAQAGRACAPSGEALGLLLCIETMANSWGGELQVARTAGLEALQLLPRSSRRWFQTIHAMWLTTIYLGQSELFDTLRDQFRYAEPAPDAISAYIEAVSFLIVMSSLVGQAKESRFFLSRLLAVSAPFVDSDVGVRGWVSFARGVFCHWILNDLWQKAQLSRETITAAELIGDRRMRCLALTSLGLAQMGMGLYAEGRETFQEALALVRKLPGETYLLGSTTAFFSIGLTDQREPRLLDEAMELCRTCIATVAPTAPSAGLSHVSLARAHLMRGDLDVAEAHARHGVQALRVERAICPLAFAALAQVLLRRGERDAAARVCAEGLALLQSIGTSCTGIELLVIAAEVEHARGEAVSAHARLREAASRLRRIALLIPEPATRQRYLTGVPLHAQLAARARDWLGAEDAAALLRID
ncbi:MAG: protein kinase [Polyangia bacterium]